MAQGHLFRGGVPTLPLFATFLQLNREHGLDRTTVSGVSWVRDVSGRHRLDALLKLFDREFGFGNHNCLNPDRYNFVATRRDLQRESE
jgi:hypothetical protein